MGILSRLKGIMKANMNSSAVQANNPEKAIDDYMRKMNQTLGAMKAETAAMVLNERRAKDLLDECNAEIKKLQRYAEKSVEEGNDDKAAVFLEKKSKQIERLKELSTAHELASSNTVSIKLMQEKLVSDIGQLETRRIELKGKLAAVKTQGGSNSGDLFSNDVYAAFEKAEADANFALDKATALAELRADEKGYDLDRKFAQLVETSDKSTSTSTNVEEELSAIKERMKLKE